MVRRAWAGRTRNARTTAPVSVRKRNSRWAGVRPGLATTTRVSKNAPVAPSAR